MYFPEVKMSSDKTIYTIRHCQEQQARTPEGSPRSSRGNEIAHANAPTTRSVQCFKRDRVKPGKYENASRCLRDIQGDRRYM